MSCAVPCLLGASSLRLTTTAVRSSVVARFLDQTLRSRLDSYKGLHKACKYYSISQKIPDFAFAFDIDGVLLRGDTALPGATDSLRYLRTQHIPFVLLTNGGGYHESRRAEKLTKELGINISTEEVIQSHTPFADMDQYKDKNVLVVGGSGIHSKEAAIKYGFKNVIIPSDIFVRSDTIWPFSKELKSYHEQIGSGSAKSINSNTDEPLKIDAIFVYNDPRDWGLDLAIIVDCLLSQQGRLGTLSSKNGDTNLPNKGYQQDGQPPLYFSNPDLWFSSAFMLPRLGQGGFQSAVEGVWNTITGGPNNGVELQRTTIGKPTQFAYEFTEKKLHQLRRNKLGEDSASRHPLKNIYMIGDNPASDIQGANNYKSPYTTSWKSVLVNTGVHEPGTIPAYEPTTIAKDVFDAVQWGMKSSGWAAMPA